MLIDWSAPSCSQSLWWMWVTFTLRASCENVHASIKKLKIHRDNRLIWGCEDAHQNALFMCHFSPDFAPPAPSLSPLLFHPHRGCLLLWSCHLAESRVWWRGDSMAGLREATELQSSVSSFYHPALSVSRLPNYLLLNLFSVSQVCWCSFSSLDVAATPLDVRDVLWVTVKTFRGCKRCWSW